MLEPLIDDPLLDHIQAIENGQAHNFWSFKNASKRRGAHALIHYPAMMVPSLQGHVLEAILKAAPHAKSVLDPFVGSGTVLVETMNLGLDFLGVDINPLAKLSCLAKSGPYYLDAFKDKAAELQGRIASDRRSMSGVDFPGRDKWFKPEVTSGLSKISRNVEREPSLWARRLFWLALARTVRSCCNSRGSTYKLHIKSAAALTSTPNSLQKFADSVDAIGRHMKDQHADWSSKGLLNKGKYVGKVDVVLGDSGTHLETLRNRKEFDVVMTSPPYGDNRTTIPYGQFAYLPLKWINAGDVDDHANTLLANSHAIDTASLGGRKSGAANKGAAMRQRYSTARRFESQLSASGDGRQRFAAFFSDLDECIESMCAVTATGGYQAWTIGSRRIQGQQVPMENLLEEMLASRDVATIGRIHRSIHAKKMATRNNLSDTMNSEIIILAKKP